MEVNRYRSSSNGLSSRSGSEAEITDGIEEFRASDLSDVSQRSPLSREIEEKIFVAVGKELKESRSVLMWALQNFPRNREFVLVHVHVPEKMIPMMGGKFPASKLSEFQVASHRHLEREKMSKTLSQYLDICASMKVQAETMVIQMDDAGKGLLALIHDHRITNMVMGAASDRNNKRRMRSPTSKKAKIVQENADPCCRLFFVCKEKLICVRESESAREGTLSQEGQPQSSPRIDVSLWGSAPAEASLPSQSSETSSVYEEAHSSVCPSEETASLVLPHVQEGIYSQLLQALGEAESLKREAYEESCRRKNAEKYAVEAARRVGMLESMHERESRQMREAEQTLARETQQLEELRGENLVACRKLYEAHEQRSALEARLAHLEQRLGEAHFLISSLEREIQERSSSSSNLEARGFSLFTYEELDRATRGFESSLKIGEGGYGTVYRGILRHTIVAIKRLHSHGTQGQNEFHHEVEVLRRVRHPNLVTLIGVCPEAWCLVYEYLPNGSLEDRLSCENNSVPLPWQSRLRVMADICSALIFLHSSKPHSIAHGDLKPANVLLDSSFGAKLGDFGLSRLLSHPSSSSSSSLLLCHRTEMPKGTIEYMDPEILVTGELTVGSDVYSLGVIILRLLTVLPALRIVRAIEEALENNTFHRVLDQSAGDWPFVQAKQLAYLALQCCGMTHKTRPDLVNGVWRILVPMMNSAFSCPSPPLPSLPLSDDDALAPSYFLCPIFQEVMKDPQVAADGYTYEGEAVRAWFEGGHRTSPMTNLVLPHQQLIPNHPLRSAIQQWLHRQQQQQQPMQRVR